MSWRKRSTVLRRITLPTACAVLLSVMATASPSARGLPSHLAHSIGGAGQWTPIAEKTNPDGTVQDLWRDASGTEITATGTPGLTVTVYPEIVTRGNGRAVNHTLTVGVTRTLSKAGFPTSGAARSAQLASSVYTTSCASIKSSDGHLYAYGCDVENLDQAIGWDWYLADQHRVSARSDCSANYFCDHLRQVFEWETWVSGNQVIDWTPQATNSVGSCTNYTISYTSTRTGTSYSESSEICPNTFGPYVLNATQFGSIWKGFPPDVNYYYEAAQSEDEVHNPPYVATTMTYRIGMAWCWDCF